MGRRVGLAGAVLLLSLAAVPATALVTAEAAAGRSLVRIGGTVTDALGRPLEGAHVSSTTRATYTAADGTYLLDMGTSTGRFAITAMRKDTLSQTKDVDALVPGDYTADFTLLYQIVGQVEPPVVSTALGGASALLTVATYAPVPGSPGQTGGASCVYVSDSRTGQTAPAAYLSTNGEGASYWTHALQVPQNSPEGAYQLGFSAKECATGTALTFEPVTLTYVVDNTAPTLSAPSPTGWIGTASPELSVAVADTGGAGFDPASAAIAVDGLPLTPTYAAGRIYAAASGLASGPHTAVASLRDWAGNFSSLAFTFSVDLTGPTLGNPSPTGEIHTRAPLLSVFAADSGSGIDPAQISMTLTYAGIVKSRLPASLDPATGRVTYQVPSGLEGVGIGRFPLIDGPYTVVVEVRDRAGNLGSLQWAFSVRTLLP